MPRLHRRDKQLLRRGRQPTARTQTTPMTDNVVPMSPPIAVDNFRRIDKGSVIASVDLTISAWHLTITCLWCFSEKNNSEWIALPSQSFTDRNGKKIYKPLVSISDKAVYDRFQKAALAAVKSLSQTKRSARFAPALSGSPLCLKPPSARAQGEAGY